MGMWRALTTTPIREKRSLGLLIVSWSLWGGFSGLLGRGAAELKIRARSWAGMYQCRPVEVRVVLTNGRGSLQFFGDHLAGSGLLLHSICRSRVGFLSRGGGRSGGVDSKRRPRIGVLLRRMCGGDRAHEVVRSASDANPVCWPERSAAGGCGGVSLWVGRTHSLVRGSPMLGLGDARPVQTAHRPARSRQQPVRPAPGQCNRRAERVATS